MSENGNESGMTETVTIPPGMNQILIAAMDSHEAEDGFRGAVGHVLKDMFNRMIQKGLDREDIEEIIYRYTNDSHFLHQTLYKEIDRALNHCRTHYPWEQPVKEKTDDELFDIAIENFYISVSIDDSTLLQGAVQEIRSRAKMIGMSDETLWQRVRLFAVGEKEKAAADHYFQPRKNIVAQYIEQHNKAETAENNKMVETRCDGGGRIEDIPEEAFEDEPEKGFILFDQDQVRMAFEALRDAAVKLEKGGIEEYNIYSLLQLCGLANSIWGTWDPDEQMEYLAACYKELELKPPKTAEIRQDGGSIDYEFVPLVPEYMINKTEWSLQYEDMLGADAIEWSSNLKIK